MILQSPLPHTEPATDCALCPRLANLRHEWQQEFPKWANAPVPLFGDPQAWLALIGLAPGKQGGNRTGRAFTGDFAGKLLFETLARHGLSEGVYAARGDDGVALHGAMLFNALRCAPPANKPSPEELRNCRPYLDAGLAALPQLRVVIALGEIAHRAAVKAMGGRLPKARFAHGAEHVMPDGRILLDSYHPSRLNLNTGTLTEAMLDAVFARALALHKG